MRHECARIAASLFGDYPISEDYKLWRQDKEFLADYKKISPENPYSEDRKFVLREFARFTKKVPGVIAECGTYRGGSAYIIAKESPNVPLHLFDSFEGLSVPVQEDRAISADHFSWQRGHLAATEAEARETLKGYREVVFHKGWIPEILTDVANEKFRLVHIDVDLYKPTMDSLIFFYPRMSPGGVIVIDDYGFTSCPGAFKAVAEFMQEREPVLHLPTGQGIIITGHR